MVNYANSDPAVVRSGRVKKTVANAVQQEASQVLGVESLSGAGGPCDIINCSGETDAQEESIHERTISRKKKSKRHRGTRLAFFWIISPICGDNLKLSLLSNTRGDTSREPEFEC